MVTVIMAGGKGTRISSLASDIPKPMIKINNKPILEYEIECLRRQGFKDIIITVSHLGQMIMDYFEDGSKFGVRIEYYFEKEPLGNAGALFRIKDKLSEVFLLLNADAIFDVDFNRMIKYHREKDALVTLFTHPNSHPYDSGLIITDKDYRVIKWLTKEDERPNWYKNRVNAGIHVINRKILDVNIDTPKIDLDRQILKPLSGSGKMVAYDSPEYVKDMGTPERYYKVVDDFKNGIVESKNLSKKQKAIFLDRDGTLNKYVGFLTDVDELQLIDGVTDAIKKINDSQYLAIVITNQPVVARGEVSFDELDEIHNKLETLLGKDGAYLDAIYYCPHHPHSGYDGEVKELKFDCECRKPKPGLILQAANDFNIDLSNSFMIGDSESDVLCGNNAGCKSFLINNNNSLNSIIDSILLGGMNGK